MSKTKTSAPHVTCTLCHRPAVMVGVWRPNQVAKAEMGQPASKPRAVIYTLCRKHARRPITSGTQVEDLVIAESRKQTGFCPENN